MFDFLPFSHQLKDYLAHLRGRGEVRCGLTKRRWTRLCGKAREVRQGTMMELRIQLIPTGEIILPPGKNGENYCNNCKVRSHSVVFNFDSEGFDAEICGDRFVRSTEILSVM